MRKALIHDWYTQYGGAERCIESMTNIWHDFDHFTLVDTLTDEQRKTILKGKATKTSFIQRMPFGKKKYRSLLPLFPLAIEQFDLSGYDLIISSSSCIAKGVLTKPDQLHITYMHSPVRYAWDLYFQYLKESKLEKGIKGFFAKYFLHKIRQWDIISANRPDYYIANSHYVSKRIKKTYNKDSLVIYPPVDTDAFNISEETGDYFIVCSRMVPYKKVDLIIKTFSKTNKKLVVIGDGPDFEKVQKYKSENIILMGYVNKPEMADLIKKARAFIFAAEEDFGISPVEAQASGIPVIAYGKGGALETIDGVFPDEIFVEEKTGVFFRHQTQESLLESLNFFEIHEKKFNKSIIRKNAERFSKIKFEKTFKETIESLYIDWKEKH